MKKILLYIVLSFFLFIPAFPSEYGTIKIITSSEGCSVIYDQHETILKGTEIIIKTTAGTHDVKVNLKDGTMIYSDSVEVSEGQSKLIDLTRKQEKHKPKTSSSPFEKYDVDNKWGKGLSVSLGIDNTNYKIDLSGASETINIGSQGDISLNYGWGIGEYIILDVGVCVVRTFGQYDNALGVKTIVTENPITLSVKWKYLGYIQGIGINYSSWTMRTTDGQNANVSPGLGYQYFIEYPMVLSEIGFIVKNGSLTENGVTADLSSSGIYYKLKYYFN